MNETRQLNNKLLFVNVLESSILLFWVINETEWIGDQLKSYQTVEDDPKVFKVFKVVYIQLERYLSQKSEGESFQTFISLLVTIQTTKIWTER